MTTRDTNDIHELTGADLDLVTGGSIAHDVNTAVKVVRQRWSMKVGVNPPYDPWA